MSRIFRALDIGCGTALSTRPLTDFASQVIGIDRKLFFAESGRVLREVVGPVSMRSLTFGPCKGNMPSN